MNIKDALIALLLLLPVTGEVAFGDIALSIERINDTEAPISGVGTIGLNDNLGGRRFFRLLNDPLVGTAPPSLTLHAITNNSVVIGGTPLLDTGTSVNLASQPDHFFLRTIDQPTDGGTFEGTVDVKLNANMGVRRLDRRRDLGQPDECRRSLVHCFTYRHS